MSLCFKGWLSNQKLVTKDAKTPQVDLFIMSFSLNHLWGQIVQCAAQCGPPVSKRKKI